MNLSKFDLNLLKTLLVLLQEKNTNRAAERLNTSQPAVSRTLAKIRDEFDDPLFIRQSRGLKLTPKAEELAKNLPKIFDDLETTLLGSQFSPSLLKGQLKIAMNGFIIESHGYQICHAISQEAPDLEIELHSFSAKTTAELISGELDFAISLYPLDISKELRQVPIGKLTFGAICRVDHPKANQTLKLQDIFKYDLAGLIIPEFNEKSMIALRLSESEHNHKIKFRSQQVNPILKAVSESDMLFIAPLSMIDNIDKQQYGLVKVADEQTRNELKVAFIYNSRYMQSEKFQWIETIVDEILPPKMLRRSPTKHK